MSRSLFIRFFDESGPAPLEELGGKCASLVALTNAGMPVPPGFAVTTAAYTAFIELSGIADDIHAWLSALDPDDVAHVDEVSARIREEIEGKPVPQEIHDELIASGHEPQPVSGRQELLERLVARHIDTAR